MALNADEERDRRHRVYKIIQDHAGRAVRRFDYGTLVDEHGTNHDTETCDNPDSLRERHRNGLSARYYLSEEIVLREDFNDDYFQGAHAGILEQISQRAETLECLDVEMTRMGLYPGWYKQSRYLLPDGFSYYDHNPSQDSQATGLRQFAFDVYEDAKDASPPSHSDHHDRDAHIITHKVSSHDTTSSEEQQYPEWELNGPPLSITYDPLFSSSGVDLSDPYPKIRYRTSDQEQKRREEEREERVYQQVLKDVAEFEAGDVHGLGRRER